MRRSFAVGTVSHVLLERLAELYFAKLVDQFKNEKFSNYPNSYHRIDTWFKANEDKLKNIIDLEVLDEIGLSLDDILEIAIDYTMLSGRGFEHITTKKSKFYQRESRVLLVVLYGLSSTDKISQSNKNLIAEAQKAFSEDNKAPFSENCKLITLDQFLRLFKVDPESEIYKHFKAISKLAFLAKGTNTNFERLQHYDILGNNYLKELETQKDLSYRPS